ncbi:MAG: GNAT family N-acetyltransferase [Alphaproteobacteria bacterium]|nr:GNAT family N-acetyltransferase [Alphaproteobacteria bacterium]
MRVSAPASDEARWCVGQYFEELSRRFGNGFDPSVSNPADEKDLVPPAGYFVLAHIDGDPVGCGALKRVDSETAEIKRMWTSDTARRRGVARKILRKLETLAEEAGFTTLHLETNETLREAQALYRNEGYREVDAFNDEPYAHHWFEKRL